MFCDQFIDPILIRKTNLHLGWVDIHVHILRRNGDMYDAERISVLHHVGLIPFLDRF